MNILKLLKIRKKSKELASTYVFSRLEVTLSGSGGQGMILAGKILAEAAAIFDGKEAVMTQSYGPEARGGASKAEIIISDGKIDYPKSMRVNVLLVMTQEAMDKYGKLLDPNGLLVVDETFVKDIPSNIKNVFKSPFSKMAMKILDATIVANVIALGAVVALTKAVSRESLIKSVLRRVPKKVVVLDRMAVDAGYKIVDDSGFKWSCNENT